MRNPSREPSGGLSPRWPQREPSPTTRHYLCGSALPPSLNAGLEWSPACPGIGEGVSALLGTTGSGSGAEDKVGVDRVACAEGVLGSHFRQRGIVSLAASRCEQHRSSNNGKNGNVTFHRVSPSGLWFDARFGFIDRLVAIGTVSGVSGAGSMRGFIPGRGFLPVLSPRRYIFSFTTLFFYPNFFGVVFFFFLKLIKELGFHQIRRHCAVRYRT